MREGEEGREERGKGSSTFSLSSCDLTIPDKHVNAKTNSTRKSGEYPLCFVSLTALSSSCFSKIRRGSGSSGRSENFISHIRVLNQNWNSFTLLPLMVFSKNSNSTSSLRARVYLCISHFKLREDFFQIGRSSLLYG